jgi:hypothetical protein
MKLQATKTSKWLISRLNKQGYNFEGYILAIYSKSIIAVSKYNEILHFTSDSKNLSPFSFYIPDLSPDCFSAGQSIKFKHNSYVLNNSVVKLSQIYDTYDESYIKPFKDILLPDAKLLNANCYCNIEFIKRREKIYKYYVSKNTSKLLEAMLEILGLGEGLTPSGDDYMTGLIYGMFVTGKTEMLEKIALLLIPEIEKNTTLISGCFLKHALKGRFSENIINNDWQNLLEFGHTSGFFALYGIYDSLNYSNELLLT